MEEGRINYRIADKCDLPDLIELRKNQLMDEGIAPNIDIDAELENYFCRQFEQESIVEWVAEAENVIVATGAILFFEFPPSYTNPTGIKGYITNMYTKKEYRKRGIAGELLDLLINEASSRGVHKIWLEASQLGKPVYKKHGFIENNNYMEI